MWLLPRGYHLVPCQDILDIPYRHSEVSLPLNKTKGFTIIVSYPSNNVKTVRQSQAVDVHTLIGNIGGYIGLFMGNSNFVYYGNEEKQRCSSFGFQSNFFAKLAHFNIVIFWCLIILGYAIMQLPEMTISLWKFIKNWKFHRRENCGRVQHTRNIMNKHKDSNNDGIMVQTKSQEDDKVFRIIKENHEWNTRRFEKIESSLEYVIRKIDQQQTKFQFFKIGLMHNSFVVLSNYTLV